MMYLLMFAVGAAWIAATIVLGLLTARAWLNVRKQLHPEAENTKAVELEKAVLVTGEGLVKLAERVGSLETKVNMLIVYGKKPTGAQG